MQTEPGSIYQWLRAGDEIFPAMLTAIDAAVQSVRLASITFLRNARWDAIFARHWWAPVGAGCG